MERKELSGSRHEPGGDNSTKSGSVKFMGNIQPTTGELSIPEFWEGYECLLSDNLFTVLALDVWNYEEYEDETIEQHYKEINRFLSSLTRLKDMGITFRDKYPKLNVELAQHRVEEAFTRLNTFRKRREVHKEFIEAQKLIGRERLEMLIKTIIADDRVTVEESLHFIEEATSLHFTEAEAAEVLLEAILDQGFKPCKPYRSEGSPLNKLLSTDFERVNRIQFPQFPTDPVSIPQPSAIMSVDDLLESGMIEEYIQNGGTTMGEKWVDFYQKTSKMFEIRSFAELKQLVEAKFLQSMVEMVIVEGGTFQMGSNDGESDERPVHNVTLDSFYIGKVPVTQDVWERVMGSNPSKFKVNKGPVEKVSWYDVTEFCNKLSEREGLQKAYSGVGESITCFFNSNGYRLPTEAEWEYAARGGSHFKGCKYSGSNDIDAVAWYNGNSGNNTHNVGTKQPNELGLYDMSGNVWEWCWDWKDDYSSVSLSAPKGPNCGSNRIVRGGSWGSDLKRCRVAHRDDYHPDSRYYSLGFRVVRSV